MQNGSRFRKYTAKILLLSIGVVFGVNLIFDMGFDPKQETGAEQTIKIVIKSLIPNDSDLYGYLKKIYWKNITKNDRTVERINVNSIDASRFIAHAGGRIDGHNYTNSLEALNLSYEKGFKYFELDIMQTSDNIYVASHDWNQWVTQTGYVGKIPPDFHSFKAHSIHGKYTSLDINDINQWFLTHSDATLVTDKVNDPEKFSKAFMFKDRLIMEVFSVEKMKEGFDEKVKTMPNWDVITQLRGNKIKQLLSFGITAVAASRSVIRENLYLVNELSHHGIRIYIYNVNKQKENNEEDIVCHDMKYVYGLYADQWDFSAREEDEISCISS